jgi:hypothetical protein
MSGTSNESYEEARGREGGREVRARGAAVRREGVENLVRDAREAMRTDVAARLHIAPGLAGLRELAQGRGAAGTGAVSWSEDGLLIEANQGNRRWLVLLLGVYLKFLQEKAPPQHAHQDSIENLHQMMRCLELEEGDDEYSETEVLLNLSHLFTLLEAVICNLWLVRTWLPACEERRNLLVPLEALRGEVERVLEEALNEREAARPAFEPIADADQSAR